MRILVTGGAGFIGSHIVDAYINAGHDVSVIDINLLDKSDNMNKRARYHDVDIRNREEVYNVFEREKPEVVNHHAAQVSVVESIEDPDLTMAVNVLGTTNLLHASHEVGVKRFIFASTGGAIYGNPEKIPADENTPPNPLSPYGLSKFLAEESILSLSPTYDYSYVILRYANVYGLRQDKDSGLVSILKNLLSNNKQPTIYGDGSKTRDYVNVYDIARANMLALDMGDNDIINIGTGIQTTDQEVFDIVAESFGYKDEPIYAPFRDGEVRHISLDVAHAKKTLGWEPEIIFRDGVLEIMD